MLTPRSANYQKLIERYGFQQQGRSGSAVLDPFAFLPYGMPRRFRWDTPCETPSFYRVCKDPGQGLPRESVDWSTVTFCDFKLFRESLEQHQQRLTLDRWLLDPIFIGTTRVLHVSIDDLGEDPRQLLTVLKDLEWQGDLFIEIYDRTEWPIKDRNLIEIRDQFQPSPVAIEYHRHPLEASSNHAAWVVDLMDPELKRKIYVSSATV